jgi:MGT family glycosyltransferase
MRHFGFLVPRSVPTSDAVDFPPGDGPAVLVSLGTTNQGQEPMLRSIVDGLAEMSVRALVTTAGQASIDSRPNVRVIDRVPHALVLPDADVVVTHAGLGTIAAALDAGVPLVCTPYDRDQPLNASRVVELGVGVTVDGDLHRAVERVMTDTSFRARAQELARVSRAEGGAAAVARELEEMR